jgi:hypothetical protein
MSEIPWRVERVGRSIVMRFGGLKKPVNKRDLTGLEDL